MPETQNTPVEQHVGLSKPDGFEQTTNDESVTGKHLFADGGHGQEKEMVTRSAHAGASSDAPASSGIPSAKTQQGVSQVAEPQGETKMGDHVQSARQSVEP